MFRLGFWLGGGGQSLTAQWATLTGEVGSLDRKYAPGDVRRYGMSPDGITLSGLTFTSGSKTVSATAGTFANVTVGKEIFSANVTTGTTVAAVGSTSITLSANATGSATGATAAVGTNWENTTNFANWLNSILATGACGFVPHGLYCCGLNLSSTYSGTEIYFEDGAEFGGVIHIIPEASPTVGGATISNVRLYGSLATYDRLGTINALDCFVQRCVVKSNPTKHTAYPGTKSRGAHLTFGCDNLQIGELIVEDCGPDNNTDAAVAIDGNGANPTNFLIDRIHIKKTDVHGLYLTGGGHRFGEVRIDAFGAGTYGGTGLQDADSLAQSQGLNGVWLNRIWDCDIETVRVSQAAGARPNAKYHVLVDETDLSGGLRSNNIGKIIADNIGIDTTTPTGYGVAFVDKDYPATNPFNLKLGHVEARVAASATMTSGYYPVGFYDLAGSSAVRSRIDFKTIRIINPVANDAFFAGIRHALYGERISCQALSGRLCDIRCGGHIGAIYGLQNGGSPSKSIAVFIPSLSKLIIDHIDIDSGSAITQQAVVIQNTVPMEIGSIYTNLIRSSSGTVQFNSSTGRTSVLEIYAKGNVVGGDVTSIGIRLSGCTDVHINRARADRFVTGFNESGTNTGCIIGELATKDNTTASSLSTVTARNSTAL